MARAQGLSGWGPITTEADLDQAFRAAVDAVRSGNCAVVDVVVDTGYDATMAAGVVGSVE